MFQEQQPRDDYAKLLHLSLAVLGVEPMQFGALGPVSDARFMGKALYSITCYMFRDSFKMSKTQVEGFRRMTLFIVRVYLKFWFECQNAAWAPANTLDFLKTLQVRSLSVTHNRSEF